MKFGSIDSSLGIRSKITLLDTLAGIRHFVNRSIIETEKPSVPDLLQNNDLSTYPSHLAHLLIFKSPGKLLIQKCKLENNGEKLLPSSSIALPHTNVTTTLLEKTIIEKSRYELDVNLRKFHLAKKFTDGIGRWTHLYACYYPARIRINPHVVEWAAFFDPQKIISLSQTPKYRSLFSDDLLSTMPFLKDAFEVAFPEERWPEIS